MASATTPISVGAPQPWPSSSSSSAASSSSSPPSKSYNFNYGCSLSLCTPNCPQFCGGFSFPPPPPLFLTPTDDSSDDSSSSHISPLMAALIAVLAAAFLLLFYFTVISKLCRRRRLRNNLRNNSASFLDADRIDSLIHDPTRPTTTNDSGLDDNFIRQITVFKFRREDNLIDGTECAVCLTEFNENENLRLMPNCEHAFHLPCIDTWLKSHSNCPLCRSSMNPAPVPVPNLNSNPTRSGTNSSGPVSNNSTSAATPTVGVGVAALRVQRSNDAVLVIRELESRVQVFETSTADDEVPSAECRNYVIEDNNNINNRESKLEINDNIINNNNNHRNSR